MGWYKSEKKLTRGQKTYIQMLQTVFNVQNEYKKWQSYIMTDYQKEYHAQSLNIQMQNAKDIILIKARGTSFTTSTLIDYIITGHTFSDLLLPVIAQREKTAQRHIRRAQQLIKHCNSDELKDAVEFSRNEIFWKNGSVMSPYPSSSAADAIRGERLLRVFIDEFAFQQNDEELIAATQETMQGDLGQLLIGSTPCGMQNKFYEIVNQIQKGKDLGFELYQWPVFDPKKFNLNILPSKQNIKPIADWISMNALDKKWKRDKHIFMQENMCDFLDDHLSYISYASVGRVVEENNVNLRDKLNTDPDFVYQTENEIVFGHDYAETTDFSAVAGFEVFQRENEPPFYKQIYLDYFRGRDTPQQIAEMEYIINAFPTLTKYRIDMTGPGIGLFEESKKRYGYKIEGIDFRKSIKTGEYRLRHNIRKYMVTNLKGLIENKQVGLISDPMQISHLTSMGYDMKVQRNKEGHGDILFADALGLLPTNYKTVYVGDMPISKDYRERSDKKNTEEETIIEKINRYRQMQRGGDM